jgi:Tol biopolymer transport system component
VRGRWIATTEMVSADSSGPASISANGRFVAFDILFDIFVHDRQTGTTQRVDVSSSGAKANRWSYIGSSSFLSANGRFVVFESRATNLVRGDTNRLGDVFVRDLRRGITKRVSVSSSGAQTEEGFGFWEGDSQNASISPDGRFVAFVTSAPNLVRGDTNRRPDVFVRDLRTGITKRVNVSSSGAQTTKRPSGSPSISDNGRLVAFESGARNLVPNDTNRRKDIFVHESRWPPRRSGS